MSAGRYFIKGCCIPGCLAGLALFFIFYVAWEVFEVGELTLEHAPGVVSIMREEDTKIIHIKGDDWQSIAYGQGFACA